MTGQQITTAEDLNALPDGTVLDCTYLARNPIRPWDRSADTEHTVRLMVSGMLLVCARQEHPRVAALHQFTSLTVVARPNVPMSESSGQAFSITAEHIARQRELSLRTFGPGPRTAGVLDHIRKELDEVAAAPTDLSEWADVIILAFDGAQRTGADPQAILDAVLAKQDRNEGRSWPDWRTQPADRAIEHDRSDRVSTRPSTVQGPGNSGGNDAGEADARCPGPSTTASRSVTSPGGAR